MRVTLVLLLLTHGIAHLPGFLVHWQLRSFPELPFRTTVFAGTVYVGLIGIKTVGVGWLLVAIALDSLLSAYCCGPHGGSHSPIAPLARRFS